MHAYIVNVFDYLKIDLERRNDILSKFADAFEIYLQESVAYLISRLYLITIFNINKFDHQTISTQQVNGNKMTINDIYNHYVSDIRTGEPLVIRHTSRILKKSVEYLDIRKSSTTEYDQLGKRQ